MWASLRNLVRNCAMNGRSSSWNPLNSCGLGIDSRLGGRSPAGGAGPPAFASGVVAVARAVFVLVNEVLRFTMVALSRSRSVLMALYLHQQQQILRLIRGRCVLTQATYFLRPMRAVRSDLRCNTPPHSTPPELPRNVPSVLTQRRLLPASRLPGTLVLVTCFSSPRSNTSLIPGIRINRLLPQTSTGIWSSSSCFLVTSESDVSRLRPYASPVWRSNKLGFKKLASISSIYSIKV